MLYQTVSADCEQFSGAMHISNLSIKLRSRPTHGLPVFCDLFMGDLNRTSNINSKTK